MRRCHAVLLAAVFLLAATTPAHAEDSRTRWYGWQTLSADGASIGLVATNATGWHGAAYVGLGTFWAAPAIIHVVHGRPLVAALSLAMRSVPFLLVAPAVRELEGGEGNNGSAGAATVFFVLSIPIAIATDAALAFDRDGGPAPAPSTTAPAQDPAPRFSPGIGFDGNGRAWAMLAGTF